MKKAALLLSVQILLFGALGAGIGCRGFNYAVQEQFGRHKRDILRSSVEKAKNEQQEANEEFKDALTTLMDLYQVEGGELEEKYRAFSAKYESCRDRSEALASRIQKARVVADDLFEEWQEEIQEIQTPKLSRLSRDKLIETRSRFNDLHASFRQSETKMDRVLQKLKDQVLFLKHNLNAQAIGSLENEFESIEEDILRLIADMNQSINEANAFIETLRAD